MSELTDRRTLLKTIGAASITTAIAGCSAGDGGDSDETPTPTDEPNEGPNHEVPHPDNENLPESEATGESLGGGERAPGSQSAQDNPSVNLQHTPSDGQNCGTCSLYVPDQDNDGFGACTTVEGKIHPCDWCLLYTEYSGDDGISCDQ